MPTYSYSCKTHGVFEVQQSIKAPALKECSKCVQEGIIEYYCEACDTSGDTPCCINCNTTEVEARSPKPKRLISLGSFILKGGGWGSEGYK